MTGTEPTTHASLMLATTIHESNTTPHHQNLGQQPNHPHSRASRRPDPTPDHPHTGNGLTFGVAYTRRGLVVSKPNSVLVIRGPASSPTGTRTACHVHQTPTHYRHDPTECRVLGAIQRIARRTEPPHDVGGAESRGAP